LAIVQVNAVGKCAAGINRCAQRAVLSYRGMTAFRTGYAIFLNCKATEEQP
jgi:hypothetical protein